MSCPLLAVLAATPDSSSARSLCPVACPRSVVLAVLETVGEEFLEFVHLCISNCSR